jgi:hypothetical protein
MPKKTFTLEQIVAKLRQIELLVGQGKTVPGVRTCIGTLEGQTTSRDRTSGRHQASASAST